MKRRVNSKLVLLLTAGTIAAISLLIGAHFIQSSRTADLFLAEAQNAVVEGDSERAVRSFRSHLRLRPDSLEGRTEYGRLLMSAGNFRDASDEFEHLLRLDPDDIQSRRNVSECLIKIGRFSDALNHIERLEYDNDAELLDWLGQCRQSAREFTGARQCYSKSIQIGPDRLNTFIRLASLLDRQLSLSNDAELVMEQMAIHNPRSAEASLIRARYCLARSERLRASGEATSAQTELSRATEFAKQAIDIDNKYVDGLLFLASCSLQNQEYQTAIKVAGQARDLSPQSVDSYLLRAEAFRLAGETEFSIEELKSGIDSLAIAASKRELHLALSSLYLDLKRVEYARESLKQASALGGEQARAKYLTGRIQLMTQDWDAALETLNSVRLSFVDRPETAKWIDFYIGEAYRNKKEWSDAITSFQRSLALAPDWIPARLSLVRTLEASGKTESAFDELRKLVRIDSAPNECWLMLAERSIQRNLNKPPDQRDWSETAKVIERIEQLGLDFAAAAILKAQFLSATGRSQQASDLLSHRLSDSGNLTNEDRRKIYFAKSNLAQQLGDWEESDRVLDAASEEFSDDVQVMLSRATQLARQSGKGSLDGLRKLLDRSPGLIPEDQAKLYTGIGELALQLGLNDFSSECFDVASQLYPDNPDVWRFGFSLAVATQKTELVQRSLEMLNSLSGKDAFWHFGEAHRLQQATSGDRISNLRQAIEHITIAKSLRPQWRKPLLLDAELQSELGSNDLAIESLEKAIELGERSPIVVQTATRLLFAKRDFERAEKILRFLNTEDIASTGGFGRAASFISIGVKDFDRGMELARKTARDSTDFEDHLWQGELARMLGKRAIQQGDSDGERHLFQEAEAAIRKAAAIAPENPLPWIQLVRFLVESKRIDDANIAMNESAESIEPKSRKLAMAQCLEALGSIDDSIVMYEQAISEDASDENTLKLAISCFLKQGRSVLSEKYLQHLLSLIDASEDAKRWGRRQLAMLRTMDGGSDNLAIANQFIQANLDGTSNTLEDLRAKAIILSAMGSDESIDQALNAWKAVTDRTVGVHPDDHFRFARLLKAEGQWSAANAQIRKAIAASANQSSEANYVGLYIAWLLQRNNLADAQTWMKRLEVIAPNTREFKALLTELLAREGKHDSAIAVLREMADAGGDRDSDTIAATAQFALRTAALTEVEDRLPYQEFVVICLRRACEADKKHRFDLARAFVSQNKPEDAINALRLQSIEAAELGAAIPTLDLLALSGALEKEHLEWLDGVVNHLSSRFGESSGLLGVRASVKKASGDYKHAVRIYRQILEKDPNNIVALNNLAISLSEDDSHLDEAATLSDQTLTLAGRVPALVDTRAVIAIAAGEAEKGLRLLNEATNNGLSAKPIYMFHRAVAHLRSGYRDKATEDFRTAIALGLNSQAIGQREQSWLSELQTSG